MKRLVALLIALTMLLSIVSMGAGCCIPCVPCIPGGDNAFIGGPA